MVSAQRLESEVIELIGPKWTFIKGQKVGDACDYVTEDGLKVELKCDLKSAITGNYYLEFCQSIRGSQLQDSGIKLAVKQANQIVFANQLEMFSVDCSVLGNWLWREKNYTRFRIATTGLFCNGNPINSESRGYLVPCAELKALAMPGSHYIRVGIADWEAVH